VPVSGLFLPADIRRRSLHGGAVDQIRLEFISIAASDRIAAFLKRWLLDTFGKPWFN
jgi:hypothetical protein